MTKLQLSRQQWTRAVKSSHTALLGHVYTCFFLLSLELSNFVKEICFSNPVGCRNYLSSPLLQAVQTGLHVHKGMPGLRYESGSTLGFICEQTGADMLTTEEWQLPTAGTQEHCPHLLSPAPPATWGPFLFKGSSTMTFFFYLQSSL